jgi:hypothetical protein
VENSADVVHQIHSVDMNIIQMATNGKTNGDTKLAPALMASRAALSDAEDRAGNELGEILHLAIAQAFAAKG